CSPTFPVYHPDICFAFLQRLKRAVCKNRKTVAVWAIAYKFLKLKLLVWAPGILGTIPTYMPLSRSFSIYAVN
ncbi:MAG: hypothetical protein ACRC2T_16620, partial [Thermoguttaceae bacterium]